MFYNFLHLKFFKQNLWLVSYYKELCAVIVTMSYLNEFILDRMEVGGICEKGERN